MTNSKTDTTSVVLTIDDTRSYTAAIHDADIDTKEILPIYLYEIDTYPGPLPTAINEAKGSTYRRAVARVKAINVCIKNNKYEFIMTNADKTIRSRNAELLIPFKDIKNFELVTFTKTRTFTAVSKKIIQLRLKQEQKIIDKQIAIDAIKSALIIEKLSDANIKQIKALIGIK